VKVDWVCSKYGSHWVIDLALTYNANAYAPMLSSSDMWGMWGAMASCQTREFGRGGAASLGVNIKQDQEL